MPSLLKRNNVVPAGTDSGDAARTRSPSARHVDRRRSRSCRPGSRRSATAESKYSWLGIGGGPSSVSGCAAHLAGLGDHETRHRRRPRLGAAVDAPPATPPRSPRASSAAALDGQVGGVDRDRRLAELVRAATVVARQIAGVGARPHRPSSSSSPQAASPITSTPAARAAHPPAASSRRHPSCSPCRQSSPSVWSSRRWMSSSQPEKRRGVPPSGVDDAGDRDRRRPASSPRGPAPATTAPAGIPVASGGPLMGDRPGRSGGDRGGQAAARRRRGTGAGQLGA